MIESVQPVVEDVDDPANVTWPRGVVSRVLVTTLRLTTRFSASSSSRSRLRSRRLRHRFTAAIAASQSDSQQREQQP